MYSAYGTETVKSMVTHGFATQAIKNYLSRWCSWWAKTNAQWTYQQLLIEFIQTVHQAGLRILAKTLLDERFEQLRTINWADNTFLAQVTL